MRKKLILFDLDGTLMDAAPAIQAAADRVRPRFQLPPLPIRDVHTFLADPVAYGGETALLVPADADGKTRRDALMLFGRHLDVLFTDYAVPYAGVPELLQELAACQYRLALVAHRITLFLYQWLDLIGWGTRFDPIVGIDAVVRPLPAPDAVQHALRVAHCKPEDALLVGNGGFALQAAHAAGIETVFTTYGYGKPQGFETAVLPQPAALLDFLTR